MKLTFTEIAIIIMIIGLVFLIIYMPKPDNSKKDIPSAAYYSTVKHDGHTYIQNSSGSFFVHNPECTNSKCFKE